MLHIPVNIVSFFCSHCYTIKNGCHSFQPFLTFYPTTFGTAIFALGTFLLFIFETSLYVHFHSCSMVWASAHVHDNDGVNAGVGSAQDNLDADEMLEHILM